MNYGFTQPGDYERKLAAYMMMTSGQQPDPYAKNGELVIPQSPLASMAPAASQMMGAYMMKNAQKPWMNPDTGQLLIGQAP